MVCGGVGGSDSQKEGVDRQETESGTYRVRVRVTLGHTETKRETDGHTTERACINIHHHPHQTPSQTARA